MKKPGCMERIVAEAAAPKTAAVEDKVLLFTTKTCPNCRIAKAMLDNEGIAYEVVDAEEVLDLTEMFKIRQAPTLVVVKDGVAESYVGPSAISGFIG